MISLRSLLAVVGFALASTGVPSFAGQLTLAVIQYSDLRDPVAMQAAFAAGDLSSLTNSDSVEAKDLAIRGGRVLFAQTIPMAKTGSFASSTRLTNQRADVKGRVSGATVSAEITIQEGVDVGIRKFSRNVFSGSGPVSGNTPTILSNRSSTGRSQTAVKGNAKLTNYTFTTLVVAQIQK